MTRPVVVVVRPEPGCGETVAAARALGLAAIGAPLFAIRPARWDVPDPDRFDAVLAGSANAFRQGGAGLARLAHLPVHAVGDRTADAAREAGFAVAATGTGGLQAVIDALPAPQRLIRLAGEERTEIALPSGITMTERIVYRAVPLDLSGEAAAALRQGGLVLLHSGAAARRFAAEVDRTGLNRAAIAIAALAPRIAAAVGGGWASVYTAEQVADGALLALATQLCHMMRRQGMPGRGAGSQNGI